MEFVSIATDWISRWVSSYGLFFVVSLAYLLNRQKRRDDLFRLRFDCYLRLRDHIFKEEHILIDNIVLSSKRELPFSNMMEIYSNKFFFDERNLYLEAKFLFGIETFIFLGSKRSRIGRFLSRKRMQSRIKKEHPNATTGEQDAIVREKVSKKEGHKHSAFRRHFEKHLTLNKMEDWRFRISKKTLHHVRETSRRIYRKLKYKIGIHDKQKRDITGKPAIKKEIE